MPKEKPLLFWDILNTKLFYETRHSLARKEQVLAFAESNIKRQTNDTHYKYFRNKLVPCKI